MEKIITAQAIVFSEDGEFGVVIKDNLVFNTTLLTSANIIFEVAVYN